MKTLSLNSRSNNFDIIRFLAAFLVILKHSNALLGQEQSLISHHNLPFLGVPIFFTISGYLITISAINSKNTIVYFWKRLLRIIPGLAVALLFTVFILGPIISQINIQDYFSNPLTYRHLLMVSLYKMENSIPNLFSDNLLTGVNGSLWTLKYEFTCYILVFVLITFRAHKFKYFMLLFFIGGISARIYLGDNFYDYNYRNQYALGHNIMYLVQWGFYFFAGMIFYLFKDKIPLKGKLVLIATIIYILILWIDADLLTYYQYVFIPYALFYISFIPSKLNNFGKHGDFSYGMYIYAFPIQQTFIVLLGASIHPLLLTLISAITVFCLSYLSWNFVEKPCLKLKNLFS